MEQKTIPYYLVDVFTDKRFGGNQLAVFIDLDDVLDHDEMLRIAKELNLAEITFVKSNSDNYRFHIRIFTTEYEVPFAGHPSLGTAYIIAKHMVEKPVSEIILEVAEGDIRIAISNPSDLGQSQFTMEQVQPQFYNEYHAHAIFQALNIPKEYLNPKLPIQRISTGLEYIIIPMISIDAIQNIQLDDINAIRWLKEQKLHRTNSHSGRTTSFFFLTSETIDPTNDYYVRMFCIESERLVEDAATGSANGCLLAYLLRHTQSSIKATVEQGYSMNRPSTLHLSGVINDGTYTIKVGGQVVPMAEGRWYI
jgi:trans-2,3-dihydro-3-hydroxyanthranilate isomerase